MNVPDLYVSALFNRTGLACLVWMVLVSVNIPAVAQQRAQQRAQSNTGMQQILPLVPVQDERQFSSDLEARDLRIRPENDRENVDDFLKSLQGEDAVVEVIVGRGRLITLKEPLSDPTKPNVPVVAVGDPTVLDLDLMPNPRMIRLLGKRVGTTDLSLLTADGRAVSFQVQVVYDLNLIRAYLKQIFPHATLEVVQMHEHLVVKGQARDTDEVNKIIQMLNAFLTSAQVARTVKSKASRRNTADPLQVPEQVPDEENVPAVSLGDAGGLPQEEKPDVSATLPPPQIINLITVPGVQQVMLQVRIAELDRGAFREIGADWIFKGSAGNAVGTNITGALQVAESLVSPGGNVTSFGLFPNGNVDFALTVLRQNQVINVLAEPNLVCMHGQEASFLAGGEFPIPVPQGLGGGSNVITIEYKTFGVQLNFVPFILNDGVIRLHVAPEVSTIDPAFSVTIPGAGDVPGLQTRRVETTVEMHQGQTLAIAGLMEVGMEGITNRIPGLGDLPVIGTMFSNTTHERNERELLVLVTPYFVNPMQPHQVPCLPGSELKDPTDHELYFGNRIEGLEGYNHRSTTNWVDPLKVGFNKDRSLPSYQGGQGYQQQQQQQHPHQQYSPQHQHPLYHNARRVNGPVGFSR